MNRRLLVGIASAATIPGLFLSQATPVSSQTAAPVSAVRDPGVRPGPLNTGAPLQGLTAGELAISQAGKVYFAEAETVEAGLGPRMNLDSCGGCHMQPAVGGSSPRINPQVAFATGNGAANTVPSFIKADGPVREVRFIRNSDGTSDGGVHSLFTISGYPGAGGCNLRQPDFEAELAKKNVIFRIPTPVFGAGLIEQIPDSAILANQAADAGRKNALGIRGRPNIVLAFNTVSGLGNKNGNDGTLARFGWKAQNKSLLMFSGEAYNVEMGITSELFQTERDETAGCQLATVPNGVTNVNAATVVDSMSSIEKFAVFMRFLAPPAPSADLPGGAASIVSGQHVFASIGCALCHTPSMQTGNSTVAALRNQPLNLYSDLLVHDMGGNLTDGISQGQAGPSEFRTAPLWGLGQRLYFLHDGRTADLREAIALHQKGNGHGPSTSEANDVVNNYNRLPNDQKQDLLNFCVLFDYFSFY